MKNQNFILTFCLISLLFVLGCKESETIFTNSSTNITTQIKIETEAILSNPMEVGETWSNTKEFDLKYELRERYGIDLEQNELLSFKIIGILAAWQSSRCRKLSHIRTDFTVPEIDDIHFESGGDDWDFICSAAGTSLFFINLIQVTPENDPYGVTKVDFAEAISRGEKITVDYSLTTDEEIEEEGMGLVFSIFSVAEFRPR